MLRRLRFMWARLQLRRALRRQDAMVRRMAAGNPVRLLVHELCSMAEAHGIQSLTARQQLVVRTWAARGQIDNGGFDFFLQGEEPLGPVAEGFRAFGFPEAAAACDRVRARVASAPAFTDQERRLAARRMREEARGEALFDPDDLCVFDVEWDALEQAMGAYMRQHPRDFPALKKVPLLGRGRAGSCEPGGGGEGDGRSPSG